MLEQSGTFSEQYGHQVDMYFVKQSGLDALLRDTSGTYTHILIGCDRFCLFDGAFNAVRDERERRSGGSRRGVSRERGSPATPSRCRPDR